ncbi:hypothetical protein [Rossellomorea marisflavi]|uniref:hypothetical protein n=1 Tax=Rossellomorea marisflavi TaxID=189381 RepID=UPI0035125173
MDAKDQRLVKNVPLRVFFSCIMSEFSGRRFFNNEEVALDTVPKDKVFSVILEGLNQAQQKKMRKGAPGLTAAVALVGITLESGFVNPMMNSVLANAPFIG